MSKKKLPTWCKVARIVCIIEDIDGATLAGKAGYTRQYTNALLNGKTAADAAINNVSDCLGISNDYDRISLRSLIPIIEASAEKQNG